MLKNLSHKIAKKALFCYCFILFYSENINRYFFTVEKYQFYSHLICIEFTACNKINADITRRTESWVPIIGNICLLLLN